MPTAHRQIADVARMAWEHASAILIAARLDDVSRSELDVPADYHDDVRDRWLRAEDRVRRYDDRRHDVAGIFAALDYGAKPAGAE